MFLKFGLNHFILSTDPWSSDFRPSVMVSSDDGPIFDNSLVTNVTAQLGGTAHLQCKVLNVKQDDHPVSLHHSPDSRHSSICSGF